LGFHRFRVNSKEKRKKKSKYINEGGGEREREIRSPEKVGGVDEIFPPVSRSPHFQKKKKTHDRNLFIVYMRPAKRLDSRRL
jgi:hypothetical protein